MVQVIVQDEIIQGKNYFIIEMGKLTGLQKEIIAHLQKQRHNLKEVHSVKDCDVILVFCPIVSRAGTDIDAAMNKLDQYEASKPAIFMVFHLTYDPNKVIPDSSRYIKRRNTLTVDYLFSEEEGLLECEKNTEALTKIAHCFKYQEQHENQQMIKRIIFLFTCLTALLRRTVAILEQHGIQQMIKRIIFPFTCLTALLRRTVAILEQHGIQQMIKRIIFPFTCLTALLRRTVAILAISQEIIQNFITGGGTSESSTNNKRN